MLLGTLSLCPTYGSRAEFGLWIKLRESDLIDVDLSAADLREADLSAATFEDCAALGTDFRRVDATGLRWRHGQLQDSRWDEASLESSQFLAVRGTDPGNWRTSTASFSTCDVKTISPIGFRPQGFTGHGAAINCVVYAPDGRRALSGSDDGTAKEWYLRSGQCLWTAMSLSNRRGRGHATWTPDRIIELGGNAWQWMGRAGPGDGGHYPLAGGVLRTGAGVAGNL